MSCGEVDWDAIGNPLPIRAIPADKELRREQFDKIDVSKNGFLSLTETLAGLPPLLEGGADRATNEKGKFKVDLDDLRPAATSAYHMARRVAPPGDDRRCRQAADCVDRREFHALLMAFGMFIELDLIFSKMDEGQMGEDRMINWKEAEKVVEKLAAWNITKKIARAKFPDEWTQSLNYKQFTEWCIMRRFAPGGPPLGLDDNDPDATVRNEAGDGSLGGILAAFQAWGGKDADSNISKEEMTTVLLALDPTFTVEMAEKLFAAADANNDGQIDYVEFSAWVTAEPMA